MTLVRWEPRSTLAPWRNVWNLQGRMNRMFDEFFAGDEDATVIRWRPAVDISETENEFTLSAELPGMTKGDIELTIKDNVLTLKGEKKLQNEKKDGDVYLSERCYGSFQRSFNLSNRSPRYAPISRQFSRMPSSSSTLMLASAPAAAKA